MASWERLVATTIEEHSREVENNTLRNHKFLAKLKAMGRISYGHRGAGNSSDDFTWRVKYQQGTLSGLDDADTLTFERLARYKKAVLDWRGYSMQDQMSEKEYQQNDGHEAIIKYFGRMGEELLEDASEEIHEEFFIDGNASGNAKRFHGIESWFGDDGNATSTTQFVTPSDTYGGLSTVLANYGGTWSNGTWPVGSGSSDYDFWSPKLLNWSATNWGSGGSALFSDNANICLRRAIIQTKASKGAKGNVDCVFMDRDLMAQFLDLNETKERISVQRGAGPTSLISLGFTDAYNYDGVDVTQDFSVPVSRAYGLNFNHLELCLLSKKKQLFEVKGPTYDIKSLAWLLAIICYGNLKGNPRAHFKMDDYA